MTANGSHLSEEAGFEAPLARASSLVPIQLFLFGFLGACGLLSLPLPGWFAGAAGGIF